MSIFLEQFSFSKSPFQARDLNRLTEHERVQKHLLETNPLALERYTGRLNAIKNIVSLANSATSETFMIRKNDVAKGVATIALDKTIIHPVEGAYTGSHLMYWMAPGMNDSVHGEVAESILDTAAGLSIPSPYVAYVNRGKVNGFRSCLKPIGEQAVLEVVSTDSFRFTSMPAQLYIS